jgi:hypothetical protein
LLLLGPMAFVVVGAVSAWSLWVAGILTIPFLAAFLLVVYVLYSYYRLVFQGRLVYGKLVSFERKLDDDTGSAHVDVRYRFVCPSGREVEGKHSVVSDELVHIPMPEPDIPVAIWYVNDKIHIML